MLGLQRDDEIVREAACKISLRELVLHGEFDSAVLQSLLDQVHDF